MNTTLSVDLARPHGRFARADLAVLALILLVSIASRVVWFGDPAPDNDEQLYSLIGARMLEGHLPFVDLWDRKPFGLFAIFALAHWIGGPGPLAYQILATGFAAAGSWLIYLLARPLADRVTACGTALLYPLLIYAYGSFSGQSEVFFLPLMLAMLLLVRGLWDGTGHSAKNGNLFGGALLAMVLGGLALQIKYTVAPQCVFLGLAALWHYRAEPKLQLVGRAALYAFAGLLPTLAIAGCYAAIGEFEAFSFANFTSIFDRTPAEGGRFAARLLQPLAPLAVLSLAGVYAAVRLNPPKDRKLYLFHAGWSGSVLVGIFLPGTIYVYYFAAFVPCTLLLALPLLDRTGHMKFVPLALVALGAAALLNVPRHWADSQRGRAELATLAQKIRPHVDAAGHCLLVYDGPTALYRMTGSCLPGRFIYPDHLNNALERGSLGVDQAGEVARILARNPGAIITADKAVTPQNPATAALIKQAITHGYRPVGQARLRDRIYRAWALSAPSQSARD